LIDVAEDPRVDRLAVAVASYKYRSWGDGAVATVARRIRYGARERVRRRVARRRQAALLEGRRVSADANDAFDELIPCFNLLADEGAQGWRLIKHDQVARLGRCAAP